ncbi:MAG: alpha/beta fold hydrolase, partial [Planctomycetaceae bacterium]
MASRTAIPDFRRQLLFPDGHSQTLAGVWLSQQLPVETAERHEVCLSDGDRLVLHSETPADWQSGGPVAVLVHGLAGSYRSPYMRRIAGKLAARGIRSYRLDLRTCGAGLSLAHRPYNSGRSADVREAIREVTRLSPGSPVGLLGFSMGANIALKLAGEDSRGKPPELVSVFAVCPPVDLQRCVRHLQATLLGRMYDRYFAKLLWKHVRLWQSATPTAPRFDFPHRPRSIEEFD